MSLVPGTAPLQNGRSNPDHDVLQDSSSSSSNSLPAARRATSTIADSIVRQYEQKEEENEKNEKNLVHGPLGTSTLTDAASAASSLPAAAAVAAAADLKPLARVRSNQSANNASSNNNNNNSTGLGVPGRHGYGYGYGYGYAVPTRSHSPDPDTLSLISADDFSELRRAESWPHPPEQEQRVRLGEHDGNEEGDEEDGREATNEEKLASRGFGARVAASWKRNKGLFLVLLAQLFGVTMNITTRLLEREGGGHGMDPFQILFARMSITCLLSSLYMWYTKTPDFPFGAKGVRILLVCRGLGGFWGVYGLYSALQYLPLSDATVLSFIAPLATGFACSKLINEPFTRVEQIGGIISLLGVVLVARPTYIFSALAASATSSSSPSDAPTDSPDGGAAVSLFIRAMEAIPEATPKERLVAVGMSMAGVLGATIAYTTIRWIGRRAHPLISVNYFAATCTVVSGTALAFAPSIPFVLPSTLREWVLLLFIGVSGFVMQFLLTAGLRYEKSSRATNMAYSQMLFAIAGDKLVWGVTPSVWSIAGSALILGSAICVAIQKDSAASSKSARVEQPGNPVNDEEMGLVEAHRLDAAAEEDDQGQQGQLPGAVEMVRMK